ncbi:B3 domain-containing protein REM10 [Acorus gramineus]|uniref:B3 domain-containing protein REM10 n=1 Tax=Acorus gramineus TaxID=55184 RepID=A0AAV9BJI8_ACOGR|nr:B3 domain-containing protein REM10 [Acorus gramineus]
MDFSSSTKPLFFKVLVHGFHKKLSIPPTFVRKHLAHLNSSKSRGTVKSPLGRSWIVCVNVNDKGCFLEDGWRLFVRDHDLRVSDFLVFQYEGRLNFSVKLFNGSGCEKEYKSGTKVDVPPSTSPNGCTKQESSGNECKITSKKRTTKSTPLRNDIATRAVYKKKGISFFEFTIKLSNLSYPYMHIPCKFAAVNGFREKGEIMVRDPGGREWQLKISHRGRLRNETRLCGEWLNLAKVNGLEVGDVCIFKFNPHSDIMDVQIAKKNSILNCCKKEATEECRTENEIEKQCPIGCTRQGSSDDECKLNLRMTEHPQTRNAAEVKDIHNRDGISFYEATMNWTNITRPYMWIPRKFADLNCLRGREIMMRDPNRRLWKMKICRYNKIYKRIFSGEWLNFAQVNGLEVGDVCIFEYNPHVLDIIDVRIVKKKSELNHCKKEMPHSAQRNTEKYITESKSEKQTPTSCLKRRASYGESEVKLKKRVRMSHQGSGSKQHLSFKISMTPYNLFDSYLSIPGEFTESNGLEDGSQMMLRDPKGRSWEVQINHKLRSKNWSQLLGQWHQFVVANALQTGDICVFKLSAGGDEDILDVRILKGQSVKEEFPSVQTGSEEYQTESQSGTLSGSFSNGIITQQDPKRVREMEHKKEATMCPQRNDTSEMDVAHTKCEASWFTVSLKTHNIKKSYMYIPAEFAASNGFQKRKKINLRDRRGRLWEMKIFNSFHPKRRESRFCGMWLQFVRANGLEVGDICLLKHVSDGEEIMDVRIIKNQPGPRPKSTRNCKIEGTRFPSSIGESRLEESTDVTEPTKTTNQEKMEGDQMKMRADTLQPSAFEYVPSMANVLALLNDTPGILKKSPEYFHAISKFTNEAHRQAFVLLVDPETRALWIKHDYGSTRNMQFNQ